MMTVSGRFKKLSKKYRYDAKLAEEKIRFVERYCTHVKGDLTGSPLLLEKWQKEEIFKPIFGLVKDNGNRLINRVYIQMPRKNGKTTMCAPIELLLLLTDAEGGAEIYNCAGDDKQANLLFSITKQMVSNSEKLSNKCKTWKSRITFNNDRFIEKITSKSDTKHGFNTHGCIYDEIHVAPNRELYDTLKTSTGQRSQPLLIAITTPGSDKESICHELYEQSKQVLNGRVENDNFWCVIYEAGKKDDPWSEKTWQKANPLYDSSPNLREYIKQEASEAKNNPSYENTFRRLHLGQWTDSETRWLNTETVDACLGKLKLETGLKCFLGIDFASTQDMVAVSILLENNDVYYWDCKMWIPEDAARKYEKKFNIPFTKWSKDGWVTVVDGNIVDFMADVFPSIQEANEEYSIQSVGYDPSYGATQMSLSLQEDLGLEINKITQGFGMHEGIDKMAEVIKNKKIVFNNPVLKWQFDNALVKTRDIDAKMRLVKTKDEKKIDGIISGIMAIMEAMQDQGVQARIIEAWD